MRINTMPWGKNYDADKHRAECQQEQVRNQLKGQVANEMGHLFEKRIIAAAEEYMRRGVARIIKVPEPFRVVKKYGYGKAQIYFTEHAEPDFIGCAAGRCVAFEAKYTETPRIKRRVITSNQEKALDMYERLGAVAGACCGIQDKYFFVPWDFFRDMDRIYGHMSATQEDLKNFEVKSTANSVCFLEYKAANVKPVLGL